MRNRSDWRIWPRHARMFIRSETNMCLCWTLYRHRSFFKFFFSFAFISFLTLLLLILAALALGESCNHQKCLNHRSAIRPLGMKPNREQWNIVTWCNLGICSVLYDNCVWLKMSVMTENFSDDWRGLLSVTLYDSWERDSFACSGLRYFARTRVRATNDSSLARAQREISFPVTLLSFFFCC